LVLSQAVHVDEATEEEAVPLGQGSHEVEASEETKPSGQAWQLVAALTLLKVPSVQNWHVKLPTLDAY
jgi:hypothetical protein